MKLAINIIMLVSFFLMVGCSENNSNKDSKITAFYADNKNNRISVVDIDTMELVNTIYTSHTDTHTAGIALSSETTTKLYSSDRKGNYIDVIDTASQSRSNVIDMPFHPRSIDAEHDTNFVAVASTNKSAAVIIDAKTDKILATVGDLDANLTEKEGHPYWLDSEHFVYIDRENKVIDTYKISQDASGKWVTSKLNELKTPSSVHHIATPDIDGKRNYNADTFYGVAEGGGNSGEYPEILKLHYSKQNGLSILQSLDLIENGIDKSAMGGHHLGFLKDGKTLYAGSKGGTVFAVDYSSSPMKIIATFQAGKGAGHIVVMKNDTKAIIINHNANFITLVDTNNHKKIANIIVSNLSDDEAAKVQVQSHTDYYYSPDEHYFYLFLTDEGAFVKVDLKNQKVVNKLEVGGHPQMGSFVKTHL